MKKTVHLWGFFKQNFNTSPDFVRGSLYFYPANRTVLNFAQTADFDQILRNENVANRIAILLPFEKYNVKKKIT